MSVEWLELRGFRCHAELSMRPELGINVLFGLNGAGKTSVLEAIGYGSTLRSFRRTPDGHLVGLGSDEAIVRLGVAAPGGEKRIEVSVPREGRRRVLLNGKRPTSNSLVAAALPVVAFLPDDLDLVKGSPGKRRDFLDELAAMLSPQAAASQRDYVRSLRQRNALLKQEGRRADEVTLSVWDERVATAGAEVALHRFALVDQLEPVVSAAYQSVAGRSVVRPTYRSAWASKVESRDISFLTADLLAALKERRLRDMDVHSTTVGPHRDEPAFTLDGRAVRTQTSQGEQRSVALALRLASYRLVEARHGVAPVLLLDDVFSELDVARSDGVMEILPRGQVFVTSAREDEVPVAGRRWRVSHGSVK